MNIFYLGDDSPRSVFRPIVGQSRKTPPNLVGHENIDTYVGDEAYVKPNILWPKKPTINNGIVTDWNDMEKIWHHTFYNELRVKPENHPILLSEPVLNPKYNCKKMIEIMFEKFMVPSMFISVDSVLSLVSYGRTTGFVLDSGYQSTRLTPVYECHAVPHAYGEMHVGGKTVTGYLSLNVQFAHLL